MIDFIINMMFLMESISVLSIQWRVANITILATFALMFSRNSNWTMKTKIEIYNSSKIMYASMCSPVNSHSFYFAGDTSGCFLNACTGNFSPPLPLTSLLLATSNRRGLYLNNSSRHTFSSDVIRPNL